MKKYITLLALAAGILGANAQAPLTFNWSFSGGTNSASGQLTTQPTISTGWDGTNGYLMTSITGTWNGVAIAGEETPPPAFDGSGSQILMSTNGTGELVDLYGMSFTTVSSLGINIYYNGGSAGTDYTSWTGTYAGGSTLGDGALIITEVAATPEPGTVALFGAGIGMLAYFRRRNARR